MVDLILDPSVSADRSSEILERARWFQHDLVSVDHEPACNYTYMLSMHMIPVLGFDTNNNRLATHTMIDMIFSTLPGGQKAIPASSTQSIPL